MDDKKPNLHEGHRARMKEKFLNYGLESFNDYQMLEVLLFYAIPKKDTNEIAHVLINQFGSIPKVLEADYDKLVAVNDIGSNAASLIKFFQMFSKQYIQMRFNKDDHILLSKPEYLCEYCISLFLGDCKEIVYALALDSDLHLIKKEKICAGDIESVCIVPRDFAVFAINNNCSSIVITHNHPQGSSEPSRADVSATIYLKNALEALQIALIDHIVVGRDGAVSVREKESSEGIWADEVL